MATEKEQIILEFQVEQGSAIQELEQTKKSIIQLKQEQNDLNKAYKSGNVTLDEYASEQVRLEAILKKQTSEYNNIQKSVTGVKTQMDKLIDSNKKISQEFQNASQNIRVAGVSVGDLTSKISSFANPATAAVSIVTALGAAYARSSIGAKDLEFAQNQLNFILDTATDKFASLFSSVEDGEGALTKYLNTYLNIGYYTPVGQSLRLFGVDLKQIAKESKDAAQAVEDLNSVREELASQQSVINERLSQNADLASGLANTELTASQRLEISKKIQDNINKNAQELLVFKSAEIEAERKLLKIRQDAGGDTGDIEKRISKLQAELTSIDLAQSRQNTNIEKQVNSINKSESQRLETLKKQNEEIKKQEDFKQSELDRANRIAKLDKEQQGPKDLSGVEDPFGTKAVKNAKIGFDKLDDLYSDSLKRQKKKRDKDRKDFIEDQEIKFEAAATYLNGISSLSAQLFGQNSAIAKVTGITEAIVNTFTGATRALRDAPPPLSFALAALTVANGLASVAQITKAAGGGDFVTKGPTLMMVGDNPGGRERVTVEPLSGRGKTVVGNGMIAMAGGGTLTTGYSDGGLSKNKAVMETNQSLMMANTIKNLPAPVVGVEEFTRVQNRVKVKQNISKR